MSHAPMLPPRTRWVLLTALLAGLYVVTFGAAWELVDGANRAVAADRLIAERQGAREQARSAIDRVLEQLTLGLYRRGHAEREAIERLAVRARAEHHRAELAAWTLGGASAALLAVIAVLAGTATLATRAVIGHLLAVSAVFLAVGLMSPILTIETHDTLPLVGEVVLEHESRGIVSTVRALATSGNVPLAVLLGLFSAVIPVVKLLVAALALAPLAPRSRRATDALIALIGRWSMTDVFVVAVLLAFLAADTWKLTDARVGPGLYFFAGYGLLSMLAGHLMIGWRGRADAAEAPST